jgi:hypothetical protein
MRKVLPFIVVVALAACGAAALRGQTVFEGNEDRAPDDGQWLGVPFNP